MNSTNLFESPELSAFIDKYHPYITEVKKRIIRVLLIFGLSALVGATFYEKIIGFLIRILSLKGINIVFTSPFQFINLALACGLVTGIITTLPYVIFQILQFLRPALQKKEFKLVLGLVPYSLFLFILGFGFGALIMKWQVEIFLERSTALGIGNILDISGLLSTVFITASIMGVGFQFPLVLLLLTSLKVITHKQLVEQRKWVYLGSFIFSMFLPPDSILADILLAMPLVVLYEITLILNWIISEKRR